MDVFNNFLNGTITLFSDPLGILIFFGGVVGGMLFGAIPGVSMLTLAAILLPFTAHLSPEHKADAVARLCDADKHELPMHAEAQR